MKLSEHFDLSEFEHSETAKKLGIDNRTPQPPKGGENAIVENLKNLCEKVLEPLREWYGAPIRISSGYRCPELNKAVGGVKNSQHMKGEAADIQPLSTSVGNGDCLPFVGPNQHSVDSVNTPVAPQGETIKLQTGNEGGLSSTNVQTGNEGGLSSTNVSNSSPSVGNGDCLPFVGPNQHSVDSVNTPVALRGDKRGVLLAWYTWMADNLRFDQLILERKSKDSNSWWIHVSLCRDDSKNRQQCLFK